MKAAPFQSALSTFLAKTSRVGRSADPTLADLQVAHETLGPGADRAEVRELAQRLAQQRRISQ